MAAIPPALVSRLLDARRNHLLPAQLKPLAQTFLQQTLGALFPQFAASTTCSEEAVQEDLILVAELLARLGRNISTLYTDVPPAPEEPFLKALVEVHALLESDARAIYEGDPAARSIDEVILTYPGFFAISVYRIAHALHLQGYPLLPRMLTEVAHEKTGIDIHPGARIGPRFCIDHGTGVVVGETSDIGADVKLYQGVTLGALTVEKSFADVKRHPTIEDRVVLYAGATILGGSTVVGHDSVVGGNAWLTQSVPPYSLISRKSEVRPRGVSQDLDFVI